MENAREIGLLPTILGVMNLIGGLLHIAFEYYLLDNDSLYRGFLLIENLLIGLLFIYFAFNIFFGDRSEKAATMKTNVLFWLCFVISFLLFQPEITSLNMIKDLLPVPQKHVLLVIGIIAFILSALSYREARNKKIFSE